MTDKETNELSGIWNKSITFTVKRTHVLLAVILGAIIYLGMVFWIGWENKMGYVVAHQSPYYAAIPEDCRNFANRHISINNTGYDELLLNRRGIRLDHQYLDPNYGGIRCLGYAVLTGLHGLPPRLADFQDTYVDADKTPIVTIRVTYHETYWSHFSSKHKGARP